jgi:antitoxin component YwqK of YwqJK toxin-antitoxin module
MYIRFATYLIVLFFSTLAIAQDINPNGYNVLKYPSGTKSSEGFMENGKPNGYWKTYYENGILKSEGNRNNFELDSIWKFYYPDGKIQTIINYRHDKKNGYSISYSKKPTNDSANVYYLSSRELYLNGIRQGMSYYYYPQGNLHYEFYYRNDKKHGEGFEYDADSVIITLFEYFNGYQIDYQKINRRDINNLKQGTWISFHKTGQIHVECSYLNDKLHGYYREYNPYGKLLAEKRYLNGELVTREIEETLEVKAEIRKTYWPNGETQFTGAFLEGQPVGLHKEYNENGILESAKIYNEFGYVIAEGLVDENGKRISKWKLFYEDGNLMATGEYKNGKKQGNWKYYYKNNQIEQKGNYLNDKPEGTWYWYYQNGDLLREENYLNGKREGTFIEYDNEGNIITNGEYFDDDKTGYWFYCVGDHTEKGSYELGLKSGVWEHFYANGTKSFEGAYRNNDPIGKHNYFFPNGTLSLSGKYRNGKKHNKWKKYNEDGSLFTVYEYKNGILIKIDGRKLDEDDIISE